MSQSNFPGSYSPYTSKIEDAAQKAFKEAFEGFVGVVYSPVAVSQQIVAGINYKFFCNAETVTVLPYNYAAIVSIYQPLEGKARITGIKEIN